MRPTSEGPRGHTALWAPQFTREGGEAHEGCPWVPAVLPARWDKGANPEGRDPGKRVEEGHPAQELGSSP